MVDYNLLARKPPSATEVDEDEQIVFTDDETTVEGLEIDGFDLSVFGIDDDEEYFEYRLPTEEPKRDREQACLRKRKRHFRTASAVLLAIVSMSFGALVPWLWYAKHLKTESHLGENQSESTRSAACSNGHNLKMTSWVGQDKTDSASICDPTVSDMQLFHQI
jgi:hypothetical protein